MLFHLPTGTKGKLKNFNRYEFYNSSILFVHFPLFDKHNLKEAFYDLPSAFGEIIYISKCKIVRENIFKTVAKTCEKDL